MICKKNIYTLVAFLLLLSFSPLGCLAEDAVANVDVNGAAVDEKVEFTYSPIGVRDPFTPLVQKTTQAAQENKPKRNLGPLGKFQLSQFRLMAMMIVKGVPTAMVKSPDGKSYTVKPGDYIGSNGGIIKKIETKTYEVDAKTNLKIEKSPDRIVVEETGYDSYTGKEFKEERYIEM